MRGWWLSTSPFIDFIGYLHQKELVTHIDDQAPDSCALIHIEAVFSCAYRLVSSILGFLYI